MSKRVFIPLSAVALVLSLCFASVADTIRLKDGSVIHGKVIGYKDQQFTVLIGGRRSTLMLYMEDVESIEFDSSTGANQSAGSAGDDDGVMSGVTSQPSAPLPRPTPSRPSTQPSPNPPTSSSRPNTTTPPTTTPRPNTSANTPRPTGSQPAYQINARVRGDNTSNGWTNTGLVVRRGQRIRITAMGQVSLGNGRFSTPAGVTSIPDRDKLMQDEATGALIAVIGDDNNDFIFVGRTRDFVAQRDGVLFLGVNESNLNDNTGAYDAVIEAEVMNR
ncbi:MAG TPA: LecA/PA-IL family lectin [Pyrinomonadaceae bacterium]